MAGLKVTGRAKYAAEFQGPRVAYAVMVQSTIPSGRIGAMDTQQAEALARSARGPYARNAPEAAAERKNVSRFLQDDQIHYNRQPIAVVVAENLQQAQHAASLVQRTLRDVRAKLDFVAGFPTSYPGSHNNEPGDVSWGDVEAGLSQAEIKIDQIYTTPIEHHNPMEPHATTGAMGWRSAHRCTTPRKISSACRKSLAKIFGIPEDNVHVMSLFVGGGFGCKGQIWSHVILAAMAARQVNRPVKLVA